MFTHNSPKPKHPRLSQVMAEDKEVIEEAKGKRFGLWPEPEIGLIIPEANIMPDSTIFADKAIAQNNKEAAKLDEEKHKSTCCRVM